MTDNTHSSQAQPTTPADEDKQRENLFSLLKQALKARGYTYAKLAARMNMSELSIKRLFKEKDCKMSRLLEICSIIGLNLDELVNMQLRFRQSPEFLAEHIEAKLASDKRLFLILILLISRLSIDMIQVLLDCDQARLYLHLRTLEKLELIELLPEGNYRFCVPMPIRLRMDGPLSGLIKSMNKRYIVHCLENENNPDYAFSTASRLMTKSSAAQIQSNLGRIREEFDYLSSQDQMFFKAEELEFFKLVFGMGPFPVNVILADG